MLHGSRHTGTNRDNKARERLCETVEKATGFVHSTRMYPGCSDGDGRYTAGVRIIEDREFVYFFLPAVPSAALRSSAISIK